jgi:two-component system alkaline phosphatase synthesis response regulator PhoP
MIHYVEDDNNIRDLVVYTLRQSGFDAQGFSDAKSFWRSFLKTTPQLLMLDIMLPNEDGLAILKRLRADAATRRLPVMMVTARSTEFDKVTGLDLGADDYLTKPFGMMEMVSRVRALLRRTTPIPSDEELVAGNLVMHTGKYIVTEHGNPIVLTHKEFELLRLLMQHKGMAFDRDKLLETVWGYDYDGGTRTIDVHVQTLRQKLGESGFMIKTVRGVGYRLEEAL